MNYSDKEILDKFFPIEEEKIGLSMIWETKIKKLKPYNGTFNKNMIYWSKNGITCFKQDTKNKLLFCDFNFVWSLFKNKNPDYNEIKQIMTDLINTTEQWKDYSINWSFLN